MPCCARSAKLDATWRGASQRVTRYRSYRGMCGNAEMWLLESIGPRLADRPRWQIASALSTARVFIILRSSPIYHSCSPSSLIRRYTRGYSILPGIIAIDAFPPGAIRVSFGSAGFSCLLASAGQERRCLCVCDPAQNSSTPRGTWLNV